MKKFIRLFVLAFALTIATFTFASCNQPTVTNEKVAENAIKLILVEQDPVVEKDFSVIGLVSYKGVSYQVTWTSDNAALTVGERQSNFDANGVEVNASYKITATRPDSGSVDATLTATINAGEGDVATKTFTYTLYAVDVFDIAAAFTFSKANKVAKESFDLPAEYTYGGKKATITWEVDKTDVVTIKDGKAEFNVKEEVAVVFTAEFTYGGVSAKFPYNVTLAPAENGPTIVTEIADGQTYFFGLNQETLGKNLYFAGKTANKDYYMATTEEIATSTKVTVNAIEGGYVLSFVNAEGATKYLDIVVNGTFVNLYIVDQKPTQPLVWDADYNTFVKEVDGGKYYIGTYKTYDTLSASNYSYISTSYPIHFYKAPLGPTAEFTEGTAYKLASYQESLGKTLYFAGKVANKDYYMATTEDASEAVDVIPVKVEGGYHLKFVNAEGATKYLDITLSGTYTNVYIVDTPTCVFTWDTTYYTFTAKVGEVTAYIGTYKTYDTLSASNYNYISTSFPCRLYTEGGSLPKAEEPTPEAPKTEEPTTDNNDNTGNTGALAAGTYTVTAKYTGSTANMTEGNNASTISLSADLFNVTATKGDASSLVGLNKDGSIRLYHGNGGEATNYAPTHNGSTLTIAVQEVEGFTIKIDKITLTGKSKDSKQGSLKVNETASNTITSGYSQEFTVNGSSVAIFNNGEVQIQLSSIVITYTVTAK